MKLSLGVVLPVYNAEDRLREQVQLVLDAVVDLTSRFEVVILDDASTDGTIEVASELAVQYPQVRYLRYNQRQGLAAVSRRGLLESTAEVVFVQEPDRMVSGTALRQFWLQRRARTVSAPAASAPIASPRALQPGLVKRLKTWASALAPQGLREVAVDAAPQLPAAGPVHVRRAARLARGH